MAYDVKILFRDNLVSAGRNSSGAPVQGKQRVVGLVNITSYTTAGESVAAKDLGLTNIDYVSFRVVDEADSTDTTPTITRALYDDSAGKLVIANVDGAGTGVAELSAGGTATVQFEAVGDSAHLVEQIV